MLTQMEDDFGLLPVLPLTMVFRFMIIIVLAKVDMMPGLEM